MGRSAAQTLGLRIVALALTFAAGVITARLLGPSARGQLAVMIAIPSLIAGLSLMGADSANLYFAGRSSEAHGSVVRFAVVHAAAVGLAAAVIVIVGAAWEPARLGLDVTLFVAGLALAPILVLGMLVGAAEAGRRHAPMVALLTAVASGVWLAGAAVVALFGLQGVEPLFAAFALAQLVLVAALLVTSRPTSWRAGPVAPGAYLRYAMSANLSGVALLVLLRLDIPLIQLLAGSREVGLYAIVLPMAESLLLLSTVIGLVLLPDSASGRVDHRRAVTIAQLATAASGVVALAMAAAAPAIVVILFGERYADAVPLLWALLPGLVLLTAGRTLQVHLMANRRFRAPTIGAAVALVLCLGLELLLIPRLGAMGAALASSLSYAAFAVIQARSVARLSGAGWLDPFMPPPLTAVRLAIAGMRRVTR
jgi:O-antigen/teichoic acid export membrane protein